MRLWVYYFVLQASLMIVGSLSFSLLDHSATTTSIRSRIGRPVVQIRVKQKKRGDDAGDGGGNIIDNNEKRESVSLSPHKVAIQQALEATRKYGPTSPEAKVAWEIAEEIEDSIFSPCSKRCDPIIPGSSPIKNQDQQQKEKFPPLFVDKVKKEIESNDGGC